MISIFKLMKFKCWSIVQVSNIIWKYKITTSVTATTVILLLIRNSVNAEPVMLLTVVYDDIWHNIELLKVIVIFDIKNLLE